MAKTTHTGGCHCGAVHFSVELDTTGQAIECNCSMCGRSGSLLMFVSPEDFKLERGEDQLTDYQFNKRVVHHLFCKTCGIKPFARGVGPKGPSVAINLRCLDDVDVFQQPRQQYDGKNR
jgi:hypothetical protein